jgi:hypothetical protein
MKGIITPALVFSGILGVALLATPGSLGAQAPPGPMSPVPSKEPPPSSQTPPPQAKPEQKDLSQKPNVAGSWKLNREESDDARKKMQEARDSSRGGIGSGGGSGPYGGGGHGRMGGGYPGGGGPYGGRGGGSQRGSSDEDRQKMQQLLTPADSLIIAQQKDKDVEVRVTDDQNRQRVFYTDGRKVQKSKDERNQEISAQWLGNRLVSEEKSPRGEKMERSFEVAPGGEKLYVTLNVGGDRSRSSVYVHYVYDIVHQNKQ